MEGRALTLALREVNRGVVMRMWLHAVGTRRQSGINSALSSVIIAR